MSGDSVYRKSNSPQSSTEVSSLQVNRLKNKEALEKRLQCRPPIKELVNQGILLYPSISHPDKVRQLQRARTSDILKHKIEKRPDRQSLVNRRIIRDDRPGTSPFITEQCHNLEKYRLKTSLSSKLTTRPGSLELIEKGVLQVDPGVDSLIRCGSLQYPRVETPTCVGTGMLPVTQSIPTPPPLSSSSSSKSVRRTSITVCSSSGVSTVVTVTSNGTNVTTTGSQRFTSAGKSHSTTGSSTSRSMKDETVISKYGSLVFHNYCPKSFDSSSSDSSSTFLQKQKAREAQQADLLRLQDTALAHQLVQQELSARAMLRHSRGDQATDARSTSPTSVCTSHTTPEPSSALSASGSPFQSYTLCSQQSPASVNPHTPAESCSSTSGHSINWAGESNSIVCTMENPSCSDSSTSVSGYACTLEQLNKTQLRAECRERKLPRSGVKAALIRQLEPHRDEILSKYFPSSYPPFSDAPELSTTSSPSTYAISIQPKPSPSTPVTSNALSQMRPAPPPPVWTAPVPSPGTVYTMNSSPWLPVATSHTTGILLCSATPTVQPIMATTSLNTSDGSATLLVTSQSDMTISSTATLRHSSSAPFITDTPGAIPGSLPCPNPPGVQTHVHMSSVPSTPLIPIKLEAADLSSGVPSSHAVGMYLGMVQAPLLSTNTGPSSKPTIFFTPKVLSFTQASNILCQTTSTSDGASFSSPSASGVLFTSSNSLGPGTSNVNTDSISTCSQSTQSVTWTASDQSHFSACPPSTSSWSSGLDRSVTVPSEELPSLGQIENMWLRIRELRRILAKAQERYSNTGSSSASSSARTDDSAHVRQLEQEHERLATLFRLVIIERIDALVEWRDSGLHSCSSDSSGVHPNQVQSTDLQVELNLMYSYLRKLGGGTINVDSVTALSPGSRPRRASSPLLDMKMGPIMPHAPTGVNQLTKTGEHMTSTPAHTVPSFSDKRQCHTTSWSDNVQTAPFGRIQNSSNKDEVIISDEPSEPPPSPMTTDVLFELWDSVAKDSVARTGHARTQSDTTTGHAQSSSLPCNLTNGTYGLPMDVDNQQVAAGDGIAEHLEQMRTVSQADEPDGGQQMDETGGAPFRHSADQLHNNTESNGNDHHRISFGLISQQALNATESFLPEDAYKPDSEKHQLSTPTAPSIACSSSSMMFDVDWSALVSAPSMFPVYNAPAKHGCSGHLCNGSHLCSTCSSEAVVPATISISDSPHSLFTALESDFRELMDTTDPVLGLSPLVINWTGDA